jgi:formylglycine-generating enzyme
MSVNFESNISMTSSIFPYIRDVKRRIGAQNFYAVWIGLALLPLSSSAQDNPAGIRWQPIAGFSMAQTETTVGQFKRFAAATQTVTLAERNGGGEVYEAGFVKKSGWNWRTPFGGNKMPADDEPAVHVSFDEAQAFCRWAGGRLPSDTEWVSAAYTEQRPKPAAGFERSKVYRFPIGDRPTGAQCLDDCGSAAKTRAISHGVRLWRGDGHALVTATPAGVNGLHDMGGNVWEWIDDPLNTNGSTERRMRGGSWWYGQIQMQADYSQTKSANTTVVYIGFRCAKAP